MTDKERHDVVDEEGLKEEELEEQDGELLPDREEMAVVKPELGLGIETLPVEPRDGT
jgi:hypothetical protein